MASGNYENPQKLLECIAERRQAFQPMRTDIALREAMGLAYVNGRHWINISGPLGNQTVEEWDEEWDAHKGEARMVDNRVGLLYRRVAATSNATRIEAAVSAARHVRSLQCSRRAAISQDILNALDLDANFTVAARQASSLRWQIGSALIVVEMARKRRMVGADVVTGADGRPIEVNDQWLRWEVLPLTDLVWDPANTSANLNQHEWLILERVMTVKRFQQIYGPIRDFGLEESRLATMGQIAPHYSTAATMTGTSVFAQYARSSREKAVRVLLMLESDDRDPGRWPVMYVVVDGSGTSSWGDHAAGQVVNFDNPVNPFGHHGRPIFKLDGFRRGDAVWSWGLPHVLMNQQDMINIARSIQFQQMMAVTHGHWIIDARATNAENFTESLATGIGGVLSWNSHADNSARPPQFVAPGAPNQEFIAIGAELALAMRDQSHITAAHLGQGRTHIDQKTQQMLLQEGSVVMDNITIQDADEYSDALKLTLGTARRCLEMPGRMLARLRDYHGLTANDLSEFFNMTPAVNEFTVRVRESSIVSRSTEERKVELSNALVAGIINPFQYRATLAGELEQPLMAIDERQLDFIKGMVIDTIYGNPWIGVSSIDFGMFETVVKDAIYGLDRSKPQYQEAMMRLEEALIVQRAINAELNPPEGSQPAGLPPPAPTQPGEESLMPDARGGPPASIDPALSPVGASGGLPFGLS